MKKHRILALYTYMVLIILLLTHISFLVSAVVKIETWNGSYSVAQYCWGNNWGAMVFTVGTTGSDSDYLLKSLSIKGWRRGTVGTGTISIYNVDGSSKPTGSPLDSTSFAGTTWSTSDNWRNNTMVNNVHLYPSTSYAIVLSSTGTSNTNCLAWDLRNTGEAYSGGGRAYSSNAGSTWSTAFNDEFVFEVWGDYFVTNFSVNLTNFNYSNNSYWNVSQDYNVLSMYWNQTKTNYINFSFNKTCDTGYNTTTTLRINGVSSGSYTWINGSRIYNLMIAKPSMINGTTYKLWINTTFVDLNRSYYHNIKFRINWLNLPIVNSTCDNTSLTVYNNTVNTTGKYETSYNSSTGNKIWLNFTGLGGGNITGYTEEEVTVYASSGILLSLAIGLIIIRRKKK